MRAEAARTGWANSTCTNKNSWLEHAALISFSGTNIVCTSVEATTLDMLVTDACVNRMNRNASEVECRGAKPGVHIQDA